jgi:hypothetical protein
MIIPTVTIGKNITNHNMKLAFMTHRGTHQQENELSIN